MDKSIYQANRKIQSDYTYILFIFRNIYIYIIFYKKWVRYFFTESVKIYLLKSQKLLLKMVFFY